MTRILPSVALLVRTGNPVIDQLMGEANEHLALAQQYYEVALTAVEGEKMDKATRLYARAAIDQNAATLCLVSALVLMTASNQGLLQELAKAKRFII